MIVKYEEVKSNMKHVVVGILAHVDAGKTTLSESMLYLAGSIKKVGRVDHGDAFLDYNQQERERGITIFSKQAIFEWKDIEITLIDTPGHVDFSSEMERTLQILDYAIIVINGLDGVQNHTQTIWHLLEHYHIPTFIFMNKMDMPQTDVSFLFNHLQKQLDERCFDFTHLNSQTLESLALTNEQMLNDYLENQTIQRTFLQEAIDKREIFPCYFGSALKMQGVEEFLDSITSLMKEKDYPQEFGAKVYKITRDEQGQRLTHMKITGGQLRVKEVIENEKVDQLRCYNGSQYQMMEVVNAGHICAVKGLSMIQPGDCIGIEKMIYQPLLNAYMNYRILLPQDCDQHTLIQQILQLSDEDPSLHICYHSQTGDLTVQLMGEVQIEVLKKIVKERFHQEIRFDQGQIIYKETIAQTVEGIGHYEPLRHYAEVHLLLEPGPRGSGLQFSSDCSEDVLDRHWQRLILTHLQEKEHLGVLTGSPITDMKITLLVGKAHIKHTEGGDFRQATYRAIRQGLKSTQSLLLEPYYQFRLEIPQTYLSKALFDIENMNGHFTILPTEGELAIVEGEAPVRKMNSYQNTVIHYTKGKGKLYCSLKGYEPSQEQDEIIKSIGYDSESDLDNPTGSVFCRQGSGFLVKWNEVKDYMHIDSGWNKQSHKADMTTYTSSLDEDEELEDIFVRTYGPRKQRFTNITQEHQKQTIVKPILPECLLVDGYNVIHSWPELKKLATDNLDSARSRLIDILANYQGYRQCLLIIVFDAYKVKGHSETVEKLHNVHVVYTKEAQTADMYIERVTHELSEKYNVIVATSDALEQMIVIGRGARRMSSRELFLEVENLTRNKKAEFERKQEKSRNFLLEDIKNYKNDE